MIRISSCSRSTPSAKAESRCRRGGEVPAVDLEAEHHVEAMRIYEAVASAAARGA